MHGLCLLREMLRNNSFGVTFMKPYLTYMLIAISVIIVVISHFIDVYWIGIAAWAIATILLAFAVYFTKYIQEDSH